MTAAISRASVWSEFGQLVIDGSLPDPERIAFQSDLVTVALDNAGDLFAWAEYLGADADSSGVNFSDTSGHWLQSAHAWRWHGWTVQLWTSNASELRRPMDIPVAGEEVAGPVEGAGSATAPTESSPAGPAVAPTTPGGDGGDCRLQDRPGAETAAGDALPPADGAHDAGTPESGGVSAAVPAPVVTGDGAAVTPDVWVPIRRRGTNYHRPGEQRSTDCGRNMFPNGVRLLVDEALVFGAVPCPRCYGGAA